MRTLVVGAGLCAEVLGAVVPIGAAGAQTTTAPATPRYVSCASTTYRFLFWPDGHPAIPSLGFPAFPTPHVELFVGTGTAFPGNQQVAYGEATGVTSSAPTCTTDTSRSGELRGVAKRKLETTTDTTVLACDVPGATVHLAQDSSGAAVVTVVGTTRAAASASVSSAGSELAYNKKLCEASAAPTG